MTPNPPNHWLKSSTPTFGATVLAKSRALYSSDLSSEVWQPIQPPAPQYALTVRDYGQLATYENGFPLNQFMPVHGNGIVTKRDALNIHNTEECVRKVLQDFMNDQESEVRRKYKIPKTFVIGNIHGLKTILQGTTATHPLIPFNIVERLKIYLFWQCSWACHFNAS